MFWGFGLAVVVVVLSGLLLGWSLTELGVTTWEVQYERFGKTVRIWGVSLITAPLLAALAIDGPWALPAMAVIIVSLNHLSRTMFRSTAAARIDPLTGSAEPVDVDPAAVGADLPTGPRSADDPAAHRPRPVQGRQRHPRPPDGR